MGLAEDLERAAVAARAHAGPGEQLSGVIAAEPAEAERVYLCAFAEAGDSQTWIALDAAGEVIFDRRLIRDAVAIAALCEAAEEAAASGLERVLEAPPRLATPAYLDELGAAARELEQANGHVSDSPFAEAMRAATPAIEELTLSVERGYKAPLR